MVSDICYISWLSDKNMRTVMRGHRNTNTLLFPSMVFGTSASRHHPNLLTCKPVSQTLHHFLRRSYRPRARPNSAVRVARNGVLSVRCYMENNNSISGFANKVIGSLPVIGLVARILSDEGGVGGDIVDFAEFRRRVGKKSTMDDSRAFYEFQDRRGRAGDPLYVLLCCWLTAVGAGLLKSEEILEGVARLRLSNDIEFEEQNFISLMNEAREKRAKLKAPAPTIPMELRVEKALDAIYVCCFGRDPIEKEDQELLTVMLSTIFPSVDSAKIQSMIKGKARRVDEGSDEFIMPEPQPLPEAAVGLQMKDLQFLRQNSSET